MVIRQILSKKQTEYISTNWDLFDDKSVADTRKKSYI